MRSLLLLLAITYCSTSALAQTRADSLRGTIGPYRAWWDAEYYAVHIKPDLAARSIQGKTSITIQALDEGQRLQIDLQQPLVVDSIVAEVFEQWGTGGSFGKPKLHFERDGNLIWVDLPKPVKAGTRMTIHIHYHGTPRAAVNAPWDGGWIWKTDAQGQPWATVACQGLGASVWYPCKDHQSDEPLGASLHITIPDGLVGVGNGRFQGETVNGDGTTTWHWRVTSPINTYNLVPYIGNYVRFAEEYQGKEGTLDISYWVLAQHEAKARQHFTQVPEMLACFEEWFGPYPFYVDGYQLIEAPHLGMEHQSAVAYGNAFRNGYMGSDLSGSGQGNDWDFIIIHESGHEWFGNSITTADIADMWVHEGFTNYSEALFVECRRGKQAAEEYVVGLRRNIKNDKPIIGRYGINQEGSGDMYYKGSNMIHTIRSIVGDSLFKALLLDMNARYRHKVVTGAEIEAYMSSFTGRELKPIFDQYLRSTQVPVLQWAVKKNRLRYKWAYTGAAFNMPVDVSLNEEAVRLAPTTTWQEIKTAQKLRSVRVAPGFYVLEREVSFVQPKVRTGFTPTF